jgi:hypothetical protein
MYIFIGPTVWKTISEELTEFKLPEDQEMEVTVLRPILFFYATQKTTMSKIMTYFTPQAIVKLIHYKFIEIHG